MKLLILVYYFLRPFWVDCVSTYFLHFYLALQLHCFYFRFGQLMFELYLDYFVVAILLLLYNLLLLLVEMFLLAHLFLRHTNLKIHILPYLLLVVMLGISHFLIYLYALCNFAHLEMFRPLLF